MHHHADLYSLLGVTRSSSNADIKQAFRKHAKLVHPDSRILSSSTPAFKVRSLT
jgi:DnaJ-class molecular chaperone